MLGKFHGIDREFDVHVAFDLAASARVDEFLGSFGNDGVAVVVEPIDQRANGRVFLIFDDGSVVECAEQGSPALEFLQQALVVDIETEGLGGRIKVGAVDKQRNFAGRRGGHSVLAFGSWRSGNRPRIPEISARNLG